jgi:CelD/BcsL family acetyltransferase involved in cellulose biosynthesis
MTEAGGSIVIADPCRDPRWTALLARHAGGLFQSPPWLAALAEAYGFRPQACLVETAAGAAAAGVAYCELDDVLGRRILSLPFSDASDPLVDTIPSWDRLLGHLVAQGVPVRLRCLDNPLVRADPRLAVTRRARWHTLAVAATPEAQWSALAGATRRAIRKAEREGIEIRPLEGEDGIAAFHRLHVGLRKRKYRLLAQPPSFLAALRRQFEPAQGWHLLGAYLGDRLIAGTLFLRWGDTLYYKFNASDLEALAARPNSLLAWAGAGLARTLGCSRLDLGPSDDDQPGLIRFKRDLGAAERELCVLDHIPPGWQDERARELRGLLGNLTTMLTRAEVPDEVAGAAGAMLYRYFA